jgi:hypothetical protein
MFTTTRESKLPSKANYVQSAYTRQLQPSAMSNVLCIAKSTATCKKGHSRFAFTVGSHYLCTLAAESHNHSTLASDSNNHATNICNRQPHVHTCMKRHASPAYLHMQLLKRQPRPMYTCMRRHAQPTYRPLASDSHGQCTLALGSMQTKHIVHLQATATTNVHLHEAACKPNISYT